MKNKEKEETIDLKLFKNKKNGQSFMFWPVRKLGRTNKKSIKVPLKVFK
jgi:hypothetical protein